MKDNFINYKLDNLIYLVAKISREMFWKPVWKTEPAY